MKKIIWNALVGSIGLDWQPKIYYANPLNMQLLSSSLKQILTKFDCKMNIKYVRKYFTQQL